MIPLIVALFRRQIGSHYQAIFRSGLCAVLDCEPIDFHPSIWDRLYLVDDAVGWGLVSQATIYEFNVVSCHQALKSHASAGLHKYTQLVACPLASLGGMKHTSSCSNSIGNHLDGSIADRSHLRDLIKQNDRAIQQWYRSRGICNAPVNVHDLHLIDWNNDD